MLLIMAMSEIASMHMSEDGLGKRLPDLSYPLLCSMYVLNYNIVLEPVWLVRPWLDHLFS